MPQDLLNADILRSHLTPQARTAFGTLLVLPTINSTNSYLLNLPSLEVHSGYVCIAEEQTAGRGRQGRSWHSPTAQNIYLSVLWEIPSKQSITGLSLVVAMAVLRALQRVNIPAQIKWPNDIIVDGKKLAGILLEMDTRQASQHFIVIGVGVNIGMTHTSEIDQPWISTEQILGQQINRNEFTAQILNRLLEELNEFTAHGLQSLHTDWPETDALKGQHISIQQGNQTHTGIAQGISPDGALLLATEHEVLTLYSGEVFNIRKINPL